MMSSRHIRSYELIDVARLLAPPKAGPGRPRTAQLRRAVSTAYYALFHELVGQAAAELCGADRGGQAARQYASRWVAHSDLRVLAEAAANAASGGTARAVASVIGLPHRDLDTVGRVFVKLQKARQRADYAHDYALTRSETLSLIDDADGAIGRARWLEQSGDLSYRRFLKLMVGAVKIARAPVS